MNQLHRIALTILLLLLGMPAVAADDVNVKYDPNTPVPRDPNTGQARAVNASTLEQSIKDDAQKTMDAIIHLDNQGLESIYTQLLIDSQKEKNVYDKQNDDKGVNRAAVSFLGNHGSFSAGGVTDISTDIGMGTYMSPPETVHFIGGGPNRLASLDNAMKRGTNWINKHTCGGFNWDAQFNFLFKAELLKEYLQNLGEGVIAAAPMALLSAYAPQLAEIVKNLKLMTAFDLSAAKMDCQQTQNVLTDGLMKTGWATRYHQCMNDYKDLGVKKAGEKCASKEEANAGWWEKADGSVYQAMSTAGAAAADWQGKAKEMMGEVLDDDDSVTGQANTTAAKQAAAAATGALLPSSPDQKAAADAQAGALTSTPADRVYGSMNEGARSVVRDMFGSFKMTGSGSLEIGHKSIKLFDISLRANAVSLANSFRLQLREHYAQLKARFPDKVALGQSYDYMSLWTWNARGGENFGTMAWTTEPYKDLTQDGQGNTPAEIKTGMDQLITNGTMDKLAVLLTEYDMMSGIKDTERVAKLQKTYDPYGFLNALCQYEYGIYLHVIFNKTLETLKNKANSTGPNQSQMKGYLDAIKINAITMEGQIQTEMIGKAQSKVLQYLAAINSYQPWVDFADGETSKPEVGIEPTVPGTITIPTP